MKRGQRVEIRAAGIECIGRVEELFQPPSALLAVGGFDTAQIREAVQDPAILRAALISYDQRTRVFVALENRMGEWRELRGLATIWNFEPSKHFRIAGTSGFGFHMWDARRLHKTRQAIALITNADEHSPGIDAALHDISEFVAEHLPLAATSLPRGYSLILNLENQRSLELNGTLFDPTAAEPQPPREAIDRLKTDIASGWLSELSDRWPEFPKIQIATNRSR